MAGECGFGVCNNNILVLDLYLFQCLFKTDVTPELTISLSINQAFILRFAVTLSLPLGNI